MLTCENLAARPAAFASLSGLSLADLEALYQEFAAAYVKDRQQSLTRVGKPRRRAQEAALRLLTTGVPAC